MLVYRVAKPGLSPIPHGPYNLFGGEELEEMFEHHCSDTENHPSPWNDGIVKSWETIPSWLYCGFLYREDLYTWFDGYIPILKEKGFQLYVYDVFPEEIEVGNTQIMFPLWSDDVPESVSNL